jgi:hypothetical protein
LATFEPFEVKSIRVSYIANEFDAEVAQETPCHDTLMPSEGLKVSPFVLLDEEGGSDSTILIQNSAPLLFSCQQARTCIG